VTAPQFPAAWGAQPPAPAPAAAPGGYAPPQQFGQFPQQPPAQYAPPVPPQQANPYAPPTHPQYPPAQPGYLSAGPYGAPPAYDPYAAAQPPAFTPAQGSLDDYMNQRPAGAQYWKFPQPGHVNIGMVERDLRDSDTHQVTFNGQPVRRKDQSISTELVLDVPLVNPDGTKSIMEFKGHQRTAFEEAVSVGSGGKRRLPEGGSMIRGTFTHTEPSRGGGSPKKIIRWEYVPADQVQQQNSNGSAPAAPQQPPQDLQYQQPAMQAPPQDPSQWAAQATAATMSPFPGQPQYPAGPYPHAPQQTASAQQVPQPAATTPPPTGQQGFPQPAPAPSSNGQPQGPPAPQPYAAPGLDPQAQAMFGNLLGGAPAQ
jgi:hypothetical protein